MGTVLAVYVVIAFVGILILAVALFISPLMIWKHTKATSAKLDIIINNLKK